MCQTKKITIQEAAYLMHKGPGFVQEHIKAGLFTFAIGQKRKSRWNFYIYPAKFFEETGYTWEDVYEAREHLQKKKEAS